jgi:hypothetical protein
MIHPDTTLKPVSLEIGLGVFATARIPRGTIVVAKDQFDTYMTLDEFRRLPEPLQGKIETYLYHDRHGRLILAWDHAKQMNHSCHSNTMLTAYDVEIAVRDIEPGEEVTTEYGLLNIQNPYPIECGCEGCRLHLRHDDIDRHHRQWDRQIRESLLLVGRTPQPLWSLLGAETKAEILSLQDNPESYISVKTLKWRSTENAPADELACADSGVK